MNFDESLHVVSTGIAGGEEVAQKMTTLPPLLRRVRPQSPDLQHNQPTPRGLAGVSGVWTGCCVKIYDMQATR